MAESTHLLGLPLKHKKSDISDFPHKQTHEFLGEDELNVAGCSGSVTGVYYPAVLSGTNRVVKIRDNTGNYWYFSGAYNTYQAPTAPNPLNSFTWSNITFATGRIADSSLARTGTYYITGSSYTTISRVLTNPSGSTGNTTRFGSADTGSIGLWINNSQVDSFNLATAFNESEREGNQTYPPSGSAGGKITIRSVGMYNSYPPYQKGSGSIALLTTDLTAGENIIQLRHVTGSGTGSATNYVFKDTGSSSPSPSTPVLTEQTLSSSKYISGVRFYYLNDIINVKFNIPYFASTTYSNNPANLTATEIGVTVGNIAVTSLTGSDGVAFNNTTNIPEENETAYYNTNLTITNSNVANRQAQVYVIAYDPFGNSGTSGSGTSTRWLISTYGNYASDLIEYFQDENYRLYSGSYNSIPGSITGVWTGSNLLQSYDSQVLTGSLIYPSTDFTSGYKPSQTANYSGHSGNQLYFRSLYKNTPNNSGTLQLNGLVLADFQSPTYTNAKIEIKLPSQTGWLDLGTAYNPATFTGVDGDGCRTSANDTTHTYGWSAGTFSTANSGYMIIVRVTLKNTTRSLTQLSEVGW